MNANIAGIARAARVGTLTVLSVLVLLTLSVEARAQQTPSIPTLGWLWYGASPAGSSLEGALIEGLGELGYVEGKTLKLEHRFAHGRPEVFVDLASDLARRHVDMIVVLGGDLAAAAKKATTTIPIVMGVSEDPVAASLVGSLARLEEI